MILETVDSAMVRAQRTGRQRLIQGISEVMDGFGCPDRQMFAPRSMILLTFVDFQGCDINCFFAGFFRMDWKLGRCSLRPDDPFPFLALFGDFLPANPFLMLCIRCHLLYLLSLR